ncbi:unnamed protein product [Closterium sp. NIES-64]|nr:unnamed protein product [Closterium sp. NIES-64]
MREIATMKNDVMFLDASFTVISNFVGLRREEVVSAATQLLMQGNPVRSGAKAEAGGTKNAPHTPQRPSGRKRLVDSSSEEDVIRNATRVALASSFVACDLTARLLQNPQLSGGTIPHWMFTRGRPLLGVMVPVGADAWGDTSGHETVKAEEEEDLVSYTEDEEDGDDTCATKYTGVKLEKASGKFGVKILIKEGGKRRQQRLGAYTLEEEAAYAYAAGAFVLRPRDKIPNTVSLSAAEKAMLRGCTKEDMQLLVEAPKWWRWRSWREVREGVNWKVKRGRKRVVATRTSKRQRVVDRNKAANKPDDPDNAESGGTAPVHNGSSGCARHNEAEEGVEESAAHEILCGIADDGTGVESASSSERNEEDGEAESDTSASASPEESGEPATGGKTADNGCARTASPKADGRESRGAGETDVYRGEGRGHVDGHVDRACGTPVDTDGHDVRISSRVLEQLIRAQDRSAKENARLEVLFLNAMAERSGGSRKHKARKQRDPEQGCMNLKRKRGETWSGGSDDDGEEDEEDTHGSGGRHMRTAKSPILQRALAHLPTDNTWKRVCELARVHLFLNRPMSSMTFYLSSDDKTHGVCTVLDRLPHSFACLALAADKSRRADLNKTLSEWKTRAAARVRDIALPKLGLGRIQPVGT